MNLPWLSCLLLLPLLGIPALWLLPARRAKPVSLTVLALALLLATGLLIGFVPDGERFQWVNRAAWLPGLGVQWLLAVDGLSVLFLPASVLLFIGVVAVSAPLRAVRAYHAWLLLLATTTLGIFCALDLVLFFVFWELSLLPVYFLLAHWGATPEAPRVAARYVLLMLGGGVPLLLAIGLLGMAGGFDGIAQLTTLRPTSGQWLPFALMLLAFGLKVPLVPLHTWLPQLALAAPGGLLAVVLGLKVGAYALIRFAVPLAPQAALDLHWLLAGLGTVSLLYGAVGILAHSNLRVALAYASVCHVGLAVLGLATLSPQGVQGAVSLLLSFSAATGGALLLLECLRRRTGSTDIHELGGAARSMPLLAGGVLICGLAGVGMPGTSSFPGEFLLVLSILERYTGAGMAALFGLAIAASAFLARYRQAFFGGIRRSTVAQSPDLRGAEWLVLLVLIAIIVGIGLYPAPWIDAVRPAAEAWAAGVRR